MATVEKTKSVEKQKSDVVLNSPRFGAPGVVTVLS